MARPAKDTDTEVTLDQSNTSETEAKTADTIKTEDGPSLKSGDVAAPGATGNKISVKTSGDFMFFDPYTLETVDPGTSTEISETAAVKNAIADGRLIKA